MMKKLSVKTGILFFFFLCFSLFVKAQEALNAVALPSEMGLEEYFNYKLIIQNATDVKDIKYPDFKNFSVLGNPVQESGKINVDGRITRYFALVFTLKPKKYGKFNIGPAAATLNGKSYKSNSVAVVVAKSQPQRQVNYDDYILHKGEKLADKVNKNMELRLEVSKNSSFVGEPIIATYKWYTRFRSESKISKNPSFNGFSVIDLLQGGSFHNTIEKLNGKEYTVYIIRKTQLYPMQSGSLVLDPAELEIQLQLIKEEYAGKEKQSMSSFFDDMPMGLLPPDAIINQTVSLQSKPVSILVKPLPEAGKPVFFNGAVGDFTLEATVKNPVFTTDEPGLLSVTISGSGNMQLLTAPDVQWPAGIELFDVKMTDKLNNSEVPVSGSKSFDYPFSVDKEGVYLIPSIEFAYFDPVNGQYKVQTTKPISCTVTKGSGIKFTGDKNIVTKAKPGFLNSIFDHRWWIVVFIATVVIAGLVIWQIKERKKTVAPIRVQTNAASKEITAIVATSVQNQLNPFEQSEKCLYDESCGNFYSLLSMELKQFLSRKFLLPMHQFNQEQLSVAMDKQGISNTTVLQLQTLMREIEWQLFTPFERNEKMTELYNKTQELAQQINLNTVTRL